jgi:RNA polymerase sigma-70 factor, ECF subfamily
MLGARVLSGRAVERSDGREASDAGEAALIERAKHDPEAFGLLYDRYVEAVYAFCLRRLDAREAAEDATSQVFTNVLAALPRYREREGAFRAWLFTVAYRVVADRFRDQQRRPTAPLDHAAELADPAPSPEESALAADASDTLARLLGRLTADQRRIVELRLAGLNGDEIARLLGKSRNAVDVAQHRALVRLRALLEREARDQEDERAR